MQWPCETSYFVVLNEWPPGVKIGVGMVEKFPYRLTLTQTWEQANKNNHSNKYVSVT